MVWKGVYIRMEDGSDSDDAETAYKTVPCSIMDI